MIASVHDEPVVTSFAGIARLFNVRNDTVRKEWALWLPPKPPGGWMIRDLIQLVRQRDAARSTPSADTLEAKEVQKRLEVAEMLTAEHQERIAKLKADEAEGRLVDTDEVIREIVEWCPLISTEIAALPDRLANIVPGEMKGTVKRMATSTCQGALRSAFVRVPFVGEINGDGSSGNS